MVDLILQFKWQQSIMTKKGKQQKEAEGHNVSQSVIEIAEW